MRKAFLSAAFFLAGVILLSQPAAAQATSFLLMPGIEGEAQDKDHKNWIDVISVSWGGGSKAPTAAAGPGWLIVIKRTDKASPSLTAKAGTKQKLAEVTLETSGAGPDGKSGTWVYNMTGVTIPFIKPAAGRSLGPQESVTLSYEKLSVTYTPQK